MLDMLVSWSGNDFRITGLCEGNPPVSGDRFQTQMSSNTDVLCVGFDSLVNKKYHGTADLRFVVACAKL